MPKHTKKVKTLVDKHKEGRLRAEEKDSSFFTTFLDYADKESIPENLSQEWKQAIKRSIHEILDEANR